MKIRDILLLLFGAVWGIVVLVTVLRSGFIPADLWAMLGVGIGGILAVFRTDDRLAGRRPPPPQPDSTEEKP